MLTLVFVVKAVVCMALVAGDASSELSKKATELGKMPKDVQLPISSIA